MRRSRCGWQKSKWQRSRPQASIRSIMSVNRRKDHADVCDSRIEQTSLHRFWIWLETDPCMSKLWSTQIWSKLKIGNGPSKPLPNISNSFSDSDRTAAMSIKSSGWGCYNPVPGTENDRQIADCQGELTQHNSATKTFFEWHEKHSDMWVTSAWSGTKYHRISSLIKRLLILLGRGTGILRLSFIKIDFLGVFYN